MAGFGFRGLTVACALGGALAQPMWAKNTPLDLFPPLSLRSIPSESMIPSLQVADRVLMDKFTYTAGHKPQRGDVVIFHHTHNDRVMIRRVIGVEGDAVQMKSGLLYLNGRPVERTLVRKVMYVSDYGALVAAREYSEQLPGEVRPHLIHEWSDIAMLDQTPIFKVPPGNLFLVGDNRDNSEDSRAPSGHRDIAKAFPDAWNGLVILSSDPRDDAFGFVPTANVMGRALTVAFTFHVCHLTDAQKSARAECPAPRIGKPL